MHVDTSSHKLKVDQDIFGWTWLGQDQSGHVTLKLSVFQEWRDRTSWYFACCYKFRKAKGYFNNFFKNGHGYLVHETLKSALSKEWVYESSFCCILTAR